MSKKLALIIANSEFSDPKLSRLVKPSRDAEMLAEVLGDPAIGGFEVTVLVNESLRVVRRKIARLYDRKIKGDLLLLHYSGHGIRDKETGDLYLAVKDTETDLASATAIETAYVRRQLDRSRSQRKVVMLDCCHSGAFESGARAGLGSYAGVEEAFEASGFGRVILTASNAVEYAWEGDELLGEAAPSVFTHFLVEGLRTGQADSKKDGKITVDELYEYVHEKVVTSEQARQTPQKWGTKLEGEIVIAWNPNPVVEVEELPVDLQNAIEDSLSWKRVGAVDELTRLLESTNPGLARAACETLKKLLKDDSLRVSQAASKVLTSRSIKEPEDISAPPPSKVEVVEPERVPEPRPEVRWEIRKKIFRIGPFEFRNYEMIIGGVIAAVLFVVLIGGINAVISKFKSVSIEPTLTSNATLSIGSTQVSPVDGMVMVYVPEGSFLMGSTSDDSIANITEFPQHEVHLNGFRIDQTEVTNAMYASFLNEEGNKGEGGVTWLDSDENVRIEKVSGEWRAVSGYGDHPVVEVTWYGARAYCGWAGRRLPSEAEWEKAARGDDERIYPWGDESPNCNLANYGGCEGDTERVGSYVDGASPYGALDMVGNVLEWMADWYDVDYYDISPSENPTGPSSGYARVVRGGFWVSNANYVRSARREGIAPHDSWSRVGFRCARGTSP